MRIRSVIVDDEPLARLRIVKLLQDHPDIKVIGQCRNGRESIAVINRKQPDLLFLDIQMPDMNGFKVLTKLDLTCPPMVVFTTAYDKYALKAFEVHAIDYLLKPFDKDRFREAIERALLQIKLRKSSEFNARLLNLLSDYRQEHLDYLTTFCIKESGRLLTIPCEEVYWIGADGNYVTLHLEKRVCLYRSTMNALAQQLEPDTFLRIHRSYLVNTLFVKRVKYLNNNEYRFTLRNGHELISSRSCKEAIVDAFSHAVLR